MTWKGHKEFSSFECDLIISCGFFIDGSDQSVDIVLLGLMHPAVYTYVE